jgi:hypothetical protein
VFLLPGHGNRGQQWQVKRQGAFGLVQRTALLSSDPNRRGPIPTGWGSWRRGHPHSWERPRHPGRPPIINAYAL